jgi:hypothetical protein
VAKDQSLESRIEEIGMSIRGLVMRFTERGFQFEHPADVLPGPESDTVTAITRIEFEVGVLPAALKLFWQRIGSVHLGGSHPEWKGCDYPDPLVVYPPSVAVQELEEFLADKEERLRSDFPYLVPIAPDFYHKANVSGGMCTICPFRPLLMIPHSTTNGTTRHSCVIWSWRSNGRASQVWPVVRGIHGRFLSLCAGLKRWGICREPLFFSGTASPGS